MTCNCKPTFKQTELGKIPTAWAIINLGELGELKNGVNFNRNDFGEGLPIINVTNLFDGRYASIENLAEIKKNAVSDYRKFLVQRGDILFARSSLVHSGAGQAAMVKMLPSEETGFSGFIIRFRRKQGELIDDEFLNYLVRSKIYREFIPQILAGTAITNINQSILSRLPIIVPSVTEQKAIVKIVSDLDSKIELNQSMNRNLEAVGQALFKRWFVDFEFPNQEGKPYKTTGGKMESTDFGEIPEGWSMKPFSEVIAVNPTRKIAKGAKAKKVEMADLNPWQPWIDSWAFDEFKSGSRFQNGDTLLARITPCLENGKTAFVSFLDPKEVAFGSTEFIILGPKAIKSSYFISYLAISCNLRASAILSMTGSSGRQRVPNDFFDDFIIAVPPDALLSKFDSLVEPLFAKITNNMRESGCLKEIRDILLPKLMSGKIRVPINKKNLEDT